tara:strand:- start:62004 stop:62690 length:687 start_codon:yes stop_codon:yes gene_type:complete
MRILGVDDDEDFNFALKTIFQKEEKEIVTTNKQSRFFEVFDKMNPDICLVDINLDTEGEGKEIVEKIRRNKEFQPKILALSRIDEQELVNEIIMSGADDFVSKPLDEFLLNEKISLHYGGEDKNLRNLSFLPKNQKDCVVQTDLNLLEVNEKGVIFISKSYVSVNSKLQIAGEYLKKYGIEQCDVVISWIRKEGEEFLIGAEFSFNHKYLSSKIKESLLNEHLEKYRA